MKRLRIDKFKYYDLVIYAARGSHSARHLATALSARRWRDDLPERYTRRRPYFRGNASPMVVNWGSTIHPQWLEDRRFKLTPQWVNRAEAVQRAIDKCAFFDALSGSELPVLRAVRDRKLAEQWLSKGFRVVARKTTTGSGGSGIVVVEPGMALPEAALYTRYYPKTHEFRAHIWKGKLIDFTQKKLRGGPNEAANRTVRSLNNGWIHAHDNLDVAPFDVEKMAQSCVDCLGVLSLDFGAVDVLASLKEGKLSGYKICEVNTGPGLENTQTIQAYSNAILELKNGS